MWNPLGFRGPTYGARGPGANPGGSPGERKGRMWWIILMVLLVAACGKESAVVAPPPPPPTQLQLTIAAGDSQIAPVATLLPQPIVVQVTDSSGVLGSFPLTSSSPVPGQLVNFHVVSGGGSVFGGSAITDSIGQAQEYWTLGPLAGSQCMEARAVVNGIAVTFATTCADATPGPAVNISLFPYAPDSVAVGDTVYIWDHVAIAQDLYGNLIGYGPLIPDSLRSDSLAPTLPAGIQLSNVYAYDGFGNQVNGTGDTWVAPPSPGTWYVRATMDSATVQFAVTVH